MKNPSEHLWPDTVLGALRSYLAQSDIFAPKVNHTQEEIQEVLEVLRSGYLYRYNVAPGTEPGDRFQGKVLQVEREVARMSNALLARAVNISIGVPDPGLG